jgi:hypothetical protein
MTAHAGHANLPHVIRLLLVFVFIVSIPACKAETASPEAEYKKLFKALVGYSRFPARGHQSRAYSLLAKETRDTLQKRVDSINATIPEGIKPLEPLDLLVVRRTRKGATISSMERVREDSDTVVLRVKYDAGEDEITMRLEDGKWRVVLPVPEAAQTN